MPTAQEPSIVMSPAYRILGMSVKPHILAIGTLAATGAGVYFGLGSSGDEQKPMEKAGDGAKGGEEFNVENMLKEFLETDAKASEGK